MTSSCPYEVHNLRLWDVDTGLAVACVSDEFSSLEHSLTLFPPAGVFCVGGRYGVEPNVYSWSGEDLGPFLWLSDRSKVLGMQFTPCGEYIVVLVINYSHCDAQLFQYTKEWSFVHKIPGFCNEEHNTPFMISPCSRVIIFQSPKNKIVSRPLYPFTDASLF